MTTAPDYCIYCDGDGFNRRANTTCGFCQDGKPLDTQEDWDNSWGRVFRQLQDGITRHRGETR